MVNRTERQQLADDLMRIKSIHGAVPAGRAELDRTKPTPQTSLPTGTSEADMEVILAYLKKPAKERDSREGQG